MKRTTYVCLILILACVFTACGKKTGEESVLKKETEPNDGFSLKQTQLTEPKNFSKDGISVTFHDIGYEEVVTNLHLQVKNDTEEALTVITANLSINGMMSDDNLFVQVPAMSEVTGTVSISNTWLGEMQIEQIAEIEFQVKAFNNFNQEILSSDVLAFHTDAPASYKQSYDNSGYTVYNNQGIVLSVRNLRKSALSDDMELVFYVENNTDDAITIVSQEVFLNGVCLEPLFVLTVGANKKAVDTMVFYDTDLKGNNITEIQTISASFRAFNENLETIFETESLHIPTQ